MSAAGRGDSNGADAGAVVDASVVVKWVVAEAGSDDAAALLDGRPLLAPELILPECANILWKKAMRGEISPGEADLAADLLARMDVELIGHRHLTSNAVSLAVELGHPAYDCAYLALALDRGVPMVPADGRFARAVAAHGRYEKHVRPLAGAGA